MKVHYKHNDTPIKVARAICGRRMYSERGVIRFTNEIAALAREYRMDTACMACVKRTRRMSGDWQDAVSVAFGYAN